MNNLHRYHCLFNAMLLMTLAACAQGGNGKLEAPDMVATTLTGVGHIGKMVGIPHFYVDGQWGGNVPGWGGGGSSVCCIKLPAQKPSMPYLVKVQWRSCDISHIKFVGGKAVDPDAQCVPSEHEATVPVHYFLPGGRGGSGLKIHFLPGNKVQAWYTEHYPESSGYPGPAYSRGPAPDYAPVPDESSTEATQGDNDAY